MKILLVSRNFPPLVGGMERLIHRAYLALVEDFDVWLLGPHGCAQYALPGSRVRACALSPTVLFLACLQWNARRLARAQAPDLVIAGSGVAAPAAVWAARAAGAAVACFVHGLDIVAPSPIYRRLFIPAVRASDLVIANSRKTAELTASVGIEAGRIRVLHPGVSVPQAVASPAEGVFRKLIDARDRRILLSVGRIHPRKGLAEFIEQALPAIVRKHPDTLFAIVGEEASNAVGRSSGEKDRILRAVRSQNLQNHVVFVGALTDQVLEAAYAESRLLVFPVIDLAGDVEGFGMVALEAAAHGLPTVAFASGGVPDAVEDGISGRLIQPGDYARFAEVVGAFLADDSNKWRQPCIAHARAFEWDRFGQGLRALCAGLVARRGA